jgi:acetyl esterase/lipase
MIALHSYVGEKHAFDYEFLKHPFISPAMASDSVLNMFPPTTFLLAGTDTFRDENLKFALRLM